MGEVASGTHLCDHTEVQSCSFSKTDHGEVIAGPLPSTAPLSTILHCRENENEWEDPWKWTHRDPGSIPASATEQLGGPGRDNPSER